MPTSWVEWHWGVAPLQPAPHLRCDLHGQLQLPALIVGGEQIAGRAARESALGTDAQVLNRHVLRGLIDAALQHVLRLKRGHFARDQTQNDPHTFPGKPQRLKTARSLLAIELQKQAIHQRRTE